MAVTITRGADGLLNYSCDGHLVITGPIKGEVVLDDGTAYNVSDDAIEVESLDHAAEVAHRIGVLHNDFGHPQAPGFVYDGQDDSQDA